MIPQLKDRIGSVIHTHYPLERDGGIQIFAQEAGLDLDGEFPLVVPYFMKEIIEEITIAARRSKYIDLQSGVSARFSIANYRTMAASARQRGARLGEKPACARISDLGHLYRRRSWQVGIDLMSSHQLSERQVLDAVIAEAIKTVSSSTSIGTGSTRSRRFSAKGVKIEVGDQLPSEAYLTRLEHVPPPLGKAFEVNASSHRQCARVASSLSSRVSTHGPDQPLGSSSVRFATRP